MSLVIPHSFNCARWIMHDAPLETVERVARLHNLPEIVARLLVSRGIEPAAIPSFLNPTLKNDLPDPFTMAGMADLAAYLAQAIMDRAPMAIFGDFDVDGATSSALLYRFLKHAGIEVLVYIPDRLTEGYGPNIQALEELKNNGARIVVLLDCGTSAFDTVAAGSAMGLEIVILDHHEPEESLPDAVHLVNPKRRDDRSGMSMLAACGVTFMACVAINRALRERGFYAKNNLSEPPLREWLDIVALGTVCDMVPLTDVNRLLVRQGFGMMQRSSNSGLRALMDVSGLKEEITPYHAGFVLGPRINAGSRVHRSDLGARLLCTDDAEEARSIAWTLNDCNDKRKEIQAQMEREALDLVEAQGLENNSVIIVESEGWHTGLSGLVAGRLKEKYAKPACVIAWVENAQGKREGRGSGRSVPGIHIAQSFMDARAAGLIEKGGGHAMAGGFTLYPENLPAFRDFIAAHVLSQAGSGGMTDETPVDGLLTVRGAKPDIVRIIQDHIGPFGQGNPEPLFLFQNIRLHSADVVGGAHVRVMVSDWEGGNRMKAMAFRSIGTPLGEALLKQGGRPFDLMGRLKLDNWGGTEKVELHITDARDAG
ncbi:MAG: single-stranded-DNA-specific exonuclease RecJ [Alphaproteobacteria bacterium]|nr:single-stranded-DNA-specific exonuclease RecJ [Alphaproteobacteria bacterium]